jgi:hypothetical protein
MVADEKKDITCNTVANRRFYSEHYAKKDLNCQAKAFAISNNYLRKFLSELEKYKQR